MRERCAPVPSALLLGALLLGGTGCRKEADKPQWDVDVAIPLVRTTLTIGDLVPDSLLVADDLGNVTLLYTTRLFALKLDTILAAPDTSFRYKYPPFDLGSGSITIFPGTQIQAADDVVRFDLEDLDLRELRVRTGEVRLKMVNRLGTIVTSDFLLPGATLNGSPLQLLVNVPSGSATNPSMLEDARALDGYTFDLRGPDFSDVNTLATDLTFTTDTGGPSVTMTQADSLEAEVRYQNIVPQYARGYFGTRVIDIEPSSSDLDLFQDVSGLLDLTEATARLKVSNGIGADVRAHIQYLRSVNAATSNTVDLIAPITSGPINLDRAVDLGSTFQEAENDFLLNNGNSNIEAFIENLPSTIAYDLDVTLDPLGDVSNGNDFFYYESALAADLEVEIPMRLTATDLTLSTTAEVDLEGTLEAHAFQGGTLHVFANNRFPFAAAIVLEIIAADGTPLATLGPGGTVASAQVDVDGHVIAGTASQVDFAISAEQLDLFYPGSAGGADGAQLHILAVFNTAGAPQPVQLSSDQSMDVQVSLEGNYVINGNK